MRGGSGAIRDDDRSRARSETTWPRVHAIPLDWSAEVLGVLRGGARLCRAVGEGVNLSPLLRVPLVVNLAHAVQTCRLMNGHG